MKTIYDTSMVLTRISRFAVIWKTRQIALDRNDRELYVKLTIEELAIYALFFVIFFVCKRNRRQLASILLLLSIYKNTIPTTHARLMTAVHIQLCVTEKSD